MSQERFPGGDGRVTGRGRAGLHWLIAAVVLAVAGASSLGGPVAARHSAASGSITANPASGPAGTMIQLSGTGFPRQADLSTDTDVLTFDGNTISPVPPIVGCTNGAPGFGFGLACSANSPYSYTIPTTTQPGRHTFHMVITDANGTPLVDASATFDVPAPATATPTATSTAVPAATATATPVVVPPTSTATPLVVAATATTMPTAPPATSTPTPTATATMTPVAASATSTAPPGATASATATSTAPAAATATATSTATMTAVPPTPTASATATAVQTKTLPPLVAIVRPQFDRDVVAVALHTAPGATIHIDFHITRVLADGSVRQVFGLVRDGHTNAAGLFALNLRIHFPAHRSGKASLTITTTAGGATQTLKRMYLYRVYK